jgi:hypothetical protein
MLRLISSAALRLSVVVSLSMLAAGCGDDEGSSGAATGGGSSSSTSTTDGAGAGATVGASTSTGPGAGTGGEDASGPGGSGSGGDGGDGAGGEGEGGALGPAPVLLGDAGSYVILAKSAITNVPTSDVTGDLGLSPAAASYITEFSMTRVGTHWTSAQVDGLIYAADNDAPTPDALTTAVGAMEAAYTDAAGRPTPDFLDIGSGGGIGGLTLEPGLYRWNSTVTIPDDITFDGGADDVWILQVTGDLEMSSDQAMTLAGGARSRNIVWQVAGDVVVGTEAHAAGIVLSQNAITLQTGSSIDGRLLAQKAVNLESATVVEPAD